MARTIKLDDSQIVYTCGALGDSLHRLEEFRIASKKKGLGHCNDVTELAMREELSALTELVESLNGEYPRVLESYDSDIAFFKESARQNPWHSALSRYLA